MPAAIDPIIKKQVVNQWLSGDSRDRISADSGIGAGTVSNIIDEWKKGVQDSDYESIRELSVFCKKQGITLNALASCIRLNNYLQSLGANANESTLESLIANLANYPDRDPAKLIEAAAQISESGIPLEKLEEHVKALMAEKETLQREIDEKCATLDGGWHWRELSRNYAVIHNWAASSLYMTTILLFLRTLSLPTSHEALLRTSPVFIVNTLCTNRPVTRPALSECASHNLF